MEKGIEKNALSLERAVEELNAIRRNYSSKTVENKIKEEFTSILLLNYFHTKWSFQNNINPEISILPWNVKFLRRDLFTFFYTLFRRYLNCLELKWYDWDIGHFFESSEYIRLTEEDLLKISFSTKKWIDKRIFWDKCYQSVMQWFFESTYYLYYESELYKNEKKLIINTLSYLYSIYWDEFEIEEGMFIRKGNVSFSKFITSFYYIWLIDVYSCGLWWGSGDVLEIFWVRILPPLKDILDKIESQRELLMDKIFDEKYKEIKIKKKNNEPHILESIIEFPGDGIRDIDLRKQYPHSEIVSKNYNGKSQKYIVKEKTKLKNQND